MGRKVAVNCSHNPGTVNEWKGTRYIKEYGISLHLQQRQGAH